MTLSYTGGAVLALLSNWMLTSDRDASLRDAVTGSCCTRSRLLTKSVLDVILAMLMLTWSLTLI